MSELFVLARKRTIWSLRRRAGAFADTQINTERKEETSDEEVLELDKSERTKRHR